MSRFISESFRALSAYVPGEQPRDRRYIKLNTNESPYPPSPKVFTAIGETELSNLRLYGDPECRMLREAIAERFGLKRENVCLGNGSDELLSFVFTAFCDSNIGVSYPDISYGFYSVFAELNGLPTETPPLRGNFSVDLTDYCASGCTVVLANPNAPTGLCLSVVDIERIVKARPDRLVVVDEAYIDFGGESCAELVKRYDNLLVVQTFSKSRALAGARLGFALGDAALIADLEKLRYSINPYNVNALTLSLGLAAFSDQSYYDRCNGEIVQTREKMTNNLRELGFEATDSKANFIFAKPPKLGGKALYEGLRERGILVRHFDKPRICDYIRITVGTPKQMETLLETVKELMA
jgi:histidinol-phosphate aminotransferase